MCQRDQQYVYVIKCVRLNYENNAPTRSTPKQFIYTNLSQAREFFVDYIKSARPNNGTEVPVNTQFNDLNNGFLRQFGLMISVKPQNETTIDGKCLFKLDDHYQGIWITLNRCPIDQDFTDYQNSAETVDNNDDWFGHIVKYWP